MTDSSLSEAAPAAESATAQAATAGTEISGQQDTPATPTGDVNEGAKAPTSVFDAVNAALKPKSDAEGSPTSDTPEKTDPAAAEVPLSDDPSPDELNRLHSQTRKRVKQLLGQRNDARNEITQLKPRAEQADRINRFVEASGLDWSEVNSGFELMRLMKNDPLEARKQLEPIWNALNKLCGHELPPDLQQKVDQGFTDEATARDLAQQRARAHLATSQHQRTVQTVQQQRERAAAQQFGASVQSAIKTFENSWKGSDPDYAVKSPRVMEKVELALSRMAAKGETLKSPADAVKLVEDAKKAVEAELKPFLRKREQIDPLPGGGVTANGSPKPKSMAEAVAAGLRA